MAFNEVSASAVAINAQVAQSVEQRTENPRVGGSIPPLGTTHKQPRFQRGFFVCGVQGLDENHRSGSTDCEAISNERASAKPAGDKQA